MAHTFRTSRKRPFEDFTCDNGELTFEKEPPFDSLVTPPGNDNMCSRCREIDFDEIFNRKCKEDSSFVMNLGSIVDLAASQCQICKMFLSVTSPRLQASNKQCHLRIFSAINSLTAFFRTSYGRLKYEDNNLLGVVPETSSPKSSGYVDVFIERDHLDATGYLSLDLPAEPLNVCRVRTLSEDCDLGIANAWMDYCDKTHPTRCVRKTFSQLRHFRVIDCRTRQVVDAPTACQYVALSYVWGDRPVSGLSSNSAPSPIREVNRPDKVIEDALIVTEELGFFYLWVDKICINQMDTTDKSHQIKQMDLIYANSALTIIAAAGTGPDYGLPGINGTPRSRQQKFQCKGRTILTTLPRGKHTLQASKWYTRGWTYQESALSKRRLVFTETQMLFECNGMNCTEVLAMDLDLLHNYKKGKINALTWSMAALSPKTPGLVPQEFMDHVREYSTKKLTYRSDALNAFRGILNIFEKAKRPVYSFWGLPIFLKDIDISRSSTQMKTSWSRSTRFAFHLFWSASTYRFQGFARGEVSFPSWSWVGWEGAVTDDGMIYYKGREYLDDVRVSFEDSHGDIFCLDDIDFDCRPPSLQDRYSSAIHIEGWTMVVQVTDHRHLQQESQSRKQPHSWDEGIYVCSSTKSYGPVFSKLESYDHLFTCAPNRTFMAFLPGPRQDSRNSAMLLEKVGDHYERVGLFRTQDGRRWYKSGTPENSGGMDEQSWTEQDECEISKLCFKLR